mgnify:CR=1 FL=1
MEVEKLIELDTSLTEAGKALHHAWLLMKDNGMESTAKELAVTVLDVDTAARRIKLYLKD